MHRFALLLALTLFATVPSVAQAVVGRIDYTEGPFSVSRSGSSLANPSIGDSVLDQDLISTQEGGTVTIDSQQVPNGDFIAGPRFDLMATSDWLLKRLKSAGVIIIDARSPAEYRAERVMGPRGGHIPGAVNIPWDRVLEPGDTRSFLPVASLHQVFTDSHIEPGREAVVYCQVGMRAAVIYFVLRLMGFGQVRLYDGGWQDWSTDTNLPVEK